MWRLAVGAFALLVSFSTLCYSETTNTSPNTSLLTDSKVAAALVALIGVIISTALSSVLSFFLARATARNTIQSEYTKRQSELALKISELISSKDDKTQKTAMRRFAVGVVKVLKPEDHPECGHVYFIPMNSRITVGRSPDNDIVLSDAYDSVSRWHCGFVSDQHSVWIDDYKSVNGTQIGDEEVRTSRQLKNDEQITLGPYTLHFRRIRENTILG